MIETFSRERERVIRSSGHGYDYIISIENLLIAWQEFLRGKRKRKDIAEFSLHLMDNILGLHKDLKEKTYEHGLYQAFTINDPKHRQIHKATVRDRLLHHAIHRILYPYFDSKFIYDSYSCRIKKGTNAAIDRFREFGRKASSNHTHTVWVLKCDVRKFFANIDHEILKTALRKYLDDPDVLSLLGKVIDSFHVKGRSGAGLPLGNLTSQLLVNVYMNEFDQFMKHEVKVRYYIRYTDDFVVLSQEKTYLEDLITTIDEFLWNDLRLQLHPNKVSIASFASGVDFLGWVHFTDHRVVRNVTKKRMMKRIEQNSKDATLQSYLGLLSHGNTSKLTEEIKRQYPVE